MAASLPSGVSLFTDFIAINTPETRPRSARRWHPAGSGWSGGFTSRSTRQGIAISAATSDTNSVNRILSAGQAHLKSKFTKIVKKVSLFFYLFWKKQTTKRAQLNKDNSAKFGQLTFRVDNEGWVRMWEIARAGKKGRFGYARQATVSDCECAN